MKQQIEQIGEYFFNTDLSDPSFEKAEVKGKILGEQNIFLSQRKKIRRNYQFYVQNYNQTLPKYNKSISEYNKNVLTFIHQNKLEHLAQSEQKCFENEIGTCVNLIAYNKAIELRNIKLGKPILQKKPLRKLRKAHENTMVLLLWSYGIQIDKLNNIYKKSSATTTRALRKLKINHKQLSELKNKDGLLMLDYTKRTIQNHVRRLVESGVLMDYTFHGHQKPVEVFISDEILVVFDAASKKEITIENQLFNFQTEKNLHNNNHVTRAYINNLNIIEPVHKQSLNKGRKIQSSYEDNKSNDKSTNLRKEKKSDYAEQTGAEILGPSSQILYAQLQEPEFLLNNCISGCYDSYRLTNKQQLEHESIKGQLTREEYRELLLQTFIKMVSSIYKGSTPTYASWRKGYNLLNENQLINTNGTIPSKINLFYKFENLVFRITYAKRFFRKFKDYKPLYPGQYFDPTRKSKKSGGFSYTLEALKRNQQYQNNAFHRKQLEIAKAKERNKRYLAIEKVEKKIDEYKNGKVTLSKLFDYVNGNSTIPIEIVQNLPKMLERAYKPIYN